MHQVIQGEVPLSCTVDHGDRDSGRPPVLFLHGFGSTHERNWVRAGWPTALAGRTLIGMDLRGHGASGRPTADADYAPAVIVADVERALDALGVGTVDAMGYSMGARNAWELAVLRPGRVRRAVLAGFGPCDPFAGADLHELATDATPFGELYRAATALEGNDPNALAACARGQASHPFSSAPVPAAPLLFVAGENDHVAEGMDELAEACEARAVRIPGRNHANAVSGRRFKEAVHAFLG